MINMRVNKHRLSICWPPKNFLLALQNITAGFLTIKKENLFEKINIVCNMLLPNYTWKKSSARKKTVCFKDLLPKLFSRDFTIVLTNISVVFY